MAGATRFGQIEGRKWTGGKRPILGAAEQAEPKPKASALANGGQNGIGRHSRLYYHICIQSRLFVDPII